MFPGLPSLTTILLLWGVLAPLGVYGWERAGKAIAVHYARKDEQAACKQRAAEAGQKANVEADKAHTAAARPGAWQRLRKSSCLDCKQ